ncbi:MAG TPA: HAMP domain-containing protein, partial [Burkholderiaceae bacterium]|nr:HAMP domain-containing protein [Burkholderiaceae bacterium]
MTLALRGLPIGTRILLLVLVVWLPAAALLTWLLYADEQNAQEAAREKVGLISASASDNTQRYLLQVGTMLERLARRPLVRALDPQRCDPLIPEYIELNPSFATLVVRDLNGRPVCSSISQPIPDVSGPEFPWFQQGLHSDGLSASEAVFWPRTGRWVTVLTHPVVDEAGRKIALLQLPVDLLRLGEELTRGVPANALVTVIDKSRAVLMRSAEAVNYVGKRPERSDADPTAGLIQGFVTTPGRDGVMRLVAFNTVPGVEWRVVAGVPEADVLAEHLSTRRRSMGIAFGALLAALLLSWRIGTGIRAPIARLAQVASRVAGGDPSARAAVGGPVEIEAVATQFNQMLDSRDAREASLRDSEARYRAVVSALAEGIVVCDRQG